MNVSVCVLLCKSNAHYHLKKKKKNKIDANYSSGINHMKSSIFTNNYHKWNKENDAMCYRIELEIKF